MTSRERRATFDSAAHLYEQARPVYPPRLFDDLVALAELETGDRLLEIGCATGKATRPLLERGFRVVCVELGRHLADEARRNLEGFPVEIHVTPFEEWDGDDGTFELVFAATAWHWLDPTIRYEKAHRLLRAGGHLAFWSALHAFPPDYDPFFEEIRDAYDAVGKPWEGRWPPATPDEIPDDRAEIEASGLFDDVHVRRYVWDRLYTGDEYVALLSTFSDHIADEPAKREYVLSEMKRRIDGRRDPKVRRHWYSILHVARRI